VFKLFKIHLVNSRHLASNRLALCAAEDSGKRRGLPESRPLLTRINQ
jgi:hypothetical protein